ncbi:hypothetical protein, conserved [Trypanosoma brucei brucei TREU927]|uniref:Uncharacterized protein n=1 Tax=Trypanosoma brucei brucei (strain 927/4 GUTat10.1) TaxID=185431 RepID=Q386M9_TRYB2|nr:hypothetical protein, conserved [Trypanosoma brucei brucei TREU927]EAN79252.1 hypothetical protein, conserved [Trypanosoma brucei brucei TREU927]
MVLRCAALTVSSFRYGHRRMISDSLVILSKHKTEDSRAAATLWGDVTTNTATRPLVSVEDMFVDVGSGWPAWHSTDEHKNNMNHYRYDSVDIKVDSGFTSSDENSSGTVMESEPTDVMSGTLIGCSSQSGGGEVSLVSIFAASGDGFSDVGRDEEDVGGVDIDYDSKREVEYDNETSGDDDYEDASGISADDVDEDTGLLDELPRAARDSASPALFFGTSSATRKANGKVGGVPPVFDDAAAEGVELETVGDAMPSPQRLQHYPSR